jgi:ABC-2 type transport system permease protein
MKRFGFLNRIWAIFIKELTQTRRDRLTFGMMFGIPIVQLTLFGFAINTDPKQLPTAILLQEQSPIIRTLLQGMAASDYFDFVAQTQDYAEADALLASGKVAFVVTFPAGFTKSFVRGDRPQILIEADASDPSASSGAIGNARTIFSRALQTELNGSLQHLAPSPDAFDLVIHAKYNPEGITQYNIVPGLLGVILTMTLVMITAMALTREREQGTLENLLALPTRPWEVMVGKIIPFLMIGSVQTVVILTAAKLMFGVPFVGSLWILLLGITIFVIANLALGITFSTLAQTQMQAMQLTFFFFLPSLLLSGFMFPFRGMPIWAQTIGEVFPLTHFLRVVRGVMLKGVSISEVQTPLMVMALFTVIVFTIAMLRYRQTLD